MPLDQIHDGIQVLFGWFDYHLHHFQTDEHRGPPTHRWTRTAKMTLTATRPWTSQRSPWEN
ncbi:IS1096 element passenger TnpR family protein [Arthrobacter sp. H14-L1]|uniref:IS1096 element passenger TnpR family protein n=1 Tax=Arthrobacter sp. H14-L1 TaxID=2996697 RepID=UPI003B640F72